MEIKFAIEPISARLMDEMVPLLAKHYAEVAEYRSLHPEPDWATYESINEAKALRIFTARDGDQLVGYSVFIVAPHSHFKAHVQAKEDLLFLDASARKGMVGVNFMKWVDDQLEAEGVEVICRSVNHKNDFSPILQRMGYEVVDLVYARRVHAPLQS